MENHKLIISPKTKVYDLLNAYPELENRLIEYVPTFEKLKNPVLRATITRITSLQQAAIIGNIPVDKLINYLRELVGQSNIQITNDMNYEMSKPNWFDTEKIAKSLDARPMLEAGEHPVNQVIADLKQMKEGEIYELTAPFLPAPLIDKARSLNFRHWVSKESESLFRIYFCQ